MFFSEDMQAKCVQMGSAVQLFEVAWFAWLHVTAGPTKIWRLESNIFDDEDD